MAAPAPSVGHFASFASEAEFFEVIYLGLPIRAHGAGYFVLEREFVGLH
jgi:hypothetical protein